MREYKNKEEAEIALKEFYKKFESLEKEYGAKIVSECNDSVLVSVKVFNEKRQRLEPFDREIWTLKD
jgi:uncharacterized Fe-S cluster-containing radical SAM superfamily enzyme